MDRACSGYMIVRRPQFGDIGGRAIPKLDIGEATGLVQYLGVDRLPWFDLDSAHYEQKLPVELEEFRQELEAAKLSWCDFKMTNSYQQAKRALAFSPESPDQNEICAVHCRPDSERTRPTFDEPVEWLGIDVYVQGYGSVIRNGIFARPDLFHEFVHRVNRHGLFDMDEAPVSLLLERCGSIPPAENIEVFPQVRDIWHQVHVGRVSEDAS